MGEAEDKQQLAKIKKVLGIVGALLVLILLAVFAPVIWRQYSAEQTFHFYNRDLIKKNYSGAYDLLINDTRNVGDLDAFTLVQQRLIDTHGELRGVEEGAINTHLADPTMVSIRETLIFERDRVPYVMLLKKSGLIWQVWGVEEE